MVTPKGNTREIIIKLWIFGLKPFRKADVPVKISKSSEKQITWAIQMASENLANYHKTWGGSLRFTSFGIEEMDSVMEPMCTEAPLERKYYENKRGHKQHILRYINRYGRELARLTNCTYRDVYDSTCTETESEESFTFFTRMKI